MDLNVNIENLGAVNSADIDIKPLTIFIGKNNTGKTWTATTICGLLDERALNTIIKILMEEPGKLDGLFDGISDVVDTLSKQKSISLDLVKFVVDNFDKYMPDVYEFYNLGIGDPHPISASNQMGIGDMLDEVTKYFGESAQDDEVYKDFLLCFL